MLADNLRKDFNDMSQDKSKSKKRTGAKTPGNELLRRIAEVTDLLVQGKSRTAVVSYCCNRFKTCERTADSYISEAMKALAANFKHDTKGQSEIALLRYQDLYDQCISARKFKDAALVQDRICKLLGLWTEKVEVEVEDWRSKLIRDIRAKEFSTIVKL